MYKLSQILDKKTIAELPNFAFKLNIYTHNTNSLHLTNL